MWCIAHNLCHSIVQQWLWCVWRTICLHDAESNEDEPSKYVLYKPAKRKHDDEDDAEDVNALFPDYSNEIRHGMLCCCIVTFTFSFH